MKLRALGEQPFHLVLKCCDFFLLETPQPESVGILGSMGSQRLTPRLSLKSSQVAQVWVRR